jgi:hypothetical protein
MSITTQIPIRLQLIEGESFHGYLARVAERNILPSTKILCETLELDCKGFVARLRLAQEKRKTVSAILGINEEQLGAAIPAPKATDPKTLVLHGLELREQHFWRSTRRFSPTSLAQSPHQRFAWELSDLGFCRETWEVLQENCPAPNCGKELAALPRSSVHRCDGCGFDLRRAEPVSIAKEDRGILQFVSDLVSLDDVEVRRGLMQVHPMFRHLNRGVLLQLISLFGRATRPKQKKCSGKRVKSALYPHLTIAGAKILRGFPASIFEADEQDVGFKSQEFFARLKELIKTGHAPSTVSFVLEMIKEVKPIASYSAQTLAIVRQDNGKITIRQAAAILGVDNSATRRIVSIGALKPTHIRGQKRQIDWFDKDEVDKLAATLKDRISTDSIHAEFGLAYTAIEQLVDLKELRWHPSPAITQCFAGKFLVDSEFRSFARRLEAEIGQQSAADVDRINLSACFALTGPAPRPWGPLLSAALAGTLTGSLKRISSKHGFKASNLTVAPEVAVQILTRSFAWQPPPEPTREECTQFEAEERLACNPQDISALLKAGELKRMNRTSAKLQRQSVIEASKNFISTREIAARMGLEFRQIGPWAKKWLLKKPDGITLWRRDEIEPFLPNSGQKDEKPQKGPPRQLTLFSST